MVTPYLGFNCQSCQAIENLAEENGCKEPSPQGEVHDFGEYRSSRCPIALLREALPDQAWLNAVHQSWDLRKSVPYNKAPAVLVDAWDEISRARNALQEWNYEQAKEARKPAAHQEGHTAERREEARRKAVSGRQVAAEV